MTGYQSKRAMAQDKLVVTDIDGHIVRDARKSKNAQPAQERNFCPRCGTRTADLTTIHTCTPPPQENA